MSRDVTFDEASMVKPTGCQQVESKTTNMILQQVESDTTSLSLNRSVSFKVISSVTQGGDQVAEHDTNMLWVMSKNSLQLKEPKEIHVSPVSSLLI